MEDQWEDRTDGWTFSILHLCERPRVLAERFLGKARGVTRVKEEEEKEKKREGRRRE